MGSGIYAALSGALAHQRQLETTATNLANISTDGYRAIRPVFHEVLAETAGPRDRAHFSVVRSTHIDTSRGALKTTGRPLDIVLPKNGFLAVQTPAGERYTRAGSLTLNAQGVLQTRNGHTVLSEAGEPIAVETDQAITITPQGEVRAGDEAVAFLRVVSFNDARRLTYEGGCLLAAQAEAGEATPSIELLEIGRLEQSNASAVKAMTDLMTASRMFETMQRAISTFSAINRRLVRVVPK
jgi:flagellar basal-body rod protein FlgF